MRPIYETTKDKERERETFRALASQLGLHYIGTPKLSVADAFFCYGDGMLAAVVELKARTTRYKTYPTYLFSATKYNALLSISSALKIPPLLIVRFSDLTAFTVLREGYEEKTGGRTDRNDAKDVETCVFIPIEDFKILAYEE